MSLPRLFVIGFCVLAMSPACGASSSPGPDGGGQGDGGGAMVDAGSGAPVSFASDVQPIFTNFCAYGGCHGGFRGQAGLSLSSGQAYGNLVGVQSTECSELRVKGGDASKSYLAAKVTGSGICYGSRMPLSGNLSSAQIGTIVNWINQGAKNN